MEELFSFAHAMADETRWRVTQLIREEALCVCEVAEILNMPQSSVSSHLQVMRKAGLLAHERCEKWIYYRLRPEFGDVVRLLAERFDATPASNAKLASDAKRAVKRLAKREKTCCPGPKELANAASDSNQNPALK